MHSGTENGFDVATFGALSRRGNWRLTEPHANDAPLLYAITRGQGRVSVAGRTRGFNAPTHLFLPPRTMHSFDLPSQVLGNRLRFPADLMADLPPDILFLRMTGGTAQSEFTHLIAQLEAELKDRADGWDIAARSYARLLGVSLSRMHAASQEGPWITGKASRLVADFTRLIEADLVAGMPAAPSVSGYAARLGITPTHLNRVCQTVCDKPASVLLQDRIVAEARYRLADTPAPVHAIANSLGYQSPAYFSRAFGQRTGLTPTAARAEAG